MGIFRQFPYTNFHELNLDELIRLVKKLETEWEDFQVDWDVDIAEQVDNWLDAHPEATTTVLDGSITTAKLADDSVTYDKIAQAALTDIYAGLKEYTIDNKVYQKKLLKKSSYDRTFISRNPRTNFVPDNTWGLQSAEYVDSLDHIVLGFTASDNSGNCLLVEVTKDFSTVIKTSAGLSLGHCNDLAYNPNNNRLYAATMVTGTYARMIVEIDVDNFTITNVFNVDRPIYQLSYDRENDVFYAGSTGNVIFDTSFNVLHESPFDTFDLLIGEATTGQGSTVLNGNYILLKETYNNVYFITHNYNSGITEQIQRYENMNGGDEAEAIFVIPNDGLYLVSGQYNISLYKYNLRFDSSNENMFSVFSSGISIPANEDLNNYLQQGKFFSIDGANTGTLSNVPAKLGNRGFSLYTFSQALNWVIQIVVGSGTQGKHIYFRFKSLSGAFSPWFNAQHEEDLINQGSPLTVNGTLQIPSDILTNNKVITIAFYRGRYTGSVTIPVSTITDGDALNGLCIFATHSAYWEFGISATGLITLKAESGLSDPYVKICY